MTAARLLAAAAAAVSTAFTLVLAPTAPALATVEEETTGVPTLVATAARSALIGTSTPYDVRLTDGGGSPVVGAEVTLHRSVDGTWRRVQTLSTGADGDAATTVRVGADPADNLFEARTVLSDGETLVSERLTINGARVATVLDLGGERSFVDGSRGDAGRAELRLTWRAVDGRPVTGRVKVFRRLAGERTWTLARQPRVVRGAATFAVAPLWRDSVWRAVAPRGVWHGGDSAAHHLVDNVPPGRVMRLPRAPRPDIMLPAQPPAAGAGLHAVATRIPNAVWRDMVGRSWHRGCPVGRAQLRLVRMNYWGFDGYRHRGELVVRDYAAGRTVRAFRTLYQLRTPIRAMYRVDRFGWSPRLRGADDYASMAADNTSAFNCRQVVGNPSATSPHAYGTAVDVNPWENPYVSRTGTVPNTWWLHRSHPLVAWRSYSHPVVRAFTARGFSWGGAYRDYHHYQRGAAGGTTVLGFGLPRRGR